MFKLDIQGVVIIPCVEDIQPTAIVMQTVIFSKTVVMMFLQSAVNKVKSIIKKNC